MSGKAINNGWCGRILKVNLSNGEIVKEPLDLRLALDFIGGRGINAKILFEGTGPDTDPLGPENILLFGTGPLNGTPVMSSARLAVTAKSPATGLIGHSNAGGEFAPELKFAGYDYVLIYGKANKPVYLLIRDDRVELREATHLWGKTTIQAQNIIRNELEDPRFQVCVIGPAGENLIRFASIMTNPPWSAAGRTGMGAVMGSKNLKAIAVRGTNSVRISGGYEKFVEVNKRWIDITRNSPGFDLWAYHGTGELVSPQALAMGSLASKNLSITDWDIEKVKELWSENYLPKYMTRHKGCMACQFCCSGGIKVDEGPFKGLTCKKAEGGSFMSLGVGLDISNAPAVFKMSSLHDELGMDTSSGGQILAVAIEWYQKGIISKKDTGDLELNWGDYDAIIKLIHKIAFREDIGDILAEGSVRAAKAIGADEETVPHIKGLEEFGGDDHYPNAALQLSYAVSPIGWDHKMGTPFAAEMGGGWLPENHPIHQLLKPYKAWEAVPEKADAEIWIERINTITDCIGFCKCACAFYYNVPVELEAFSEYLSVVTGTDFSVSDLEKIADRIWTLERAYDVREGITRKDDIIPSRVIRKRKTGPLAGKLIDKNQWERLLDAYYEKRGWAKNSGIPTRQLLESLGLKTVADELNTRGLLNE